MEHQKWAPKSHVTHHYIRKPSSHHGLQVCYLLRYGLKQPSPKHGYESKGMLPRPEAVTSREHDAVKPRLINLLEWETTETFLYDGASLAPSIEGYFVAALAQRVGNGYIGMDMTRKWPYCKEESGH
jgi:hypothetical protein